MPDVQHSPWDTLDIILGNLVFFFQKESTELLNLASSHRQRVVPAFPYGWSASKPTVWPGTTARTAPFKILESHEQNAVVPEDYEFCQLRRRQMRGIGDTLKL